MTEKKPSKGPWILVAVVFLLLAALWAAFIVFAEKHKPEPIEVPAAASAEQERPPPYATGMPVPCGTRTGHLLSSDGRNPPSGLDSAAFPA